jgi:anti-anti-sigma regulatory factor
MLSHRWRNGGAMLRITHVQTENELRWTLCGQLTGPWVAEFRSSFAHHGHVAGIASMVVDLSDVTFIDESGEMLLLEMKSAGAEFVACGVDTKHLLEHLKANSERPLRRFNAPQGNSKTTIGEEK